jgi:hypothetical protein
MTELELYKFVKDHNLEYHWHTHSLGYHNDIKDVIMFVPIHQLGEFCKLLGQSIMDEDGLECTMKYGYIVFWMDEICEHFDIELSNVFKVEDEE